MLNRSKTNDILKGEVLLTINSLQKPMSQNRRKITFGMMVIIYVLSWIHSAVITAHEPLIKFFFPIVLTVLYVIGLPWILLLRNSKGTALTITEKGLAFWPIVAERWTDIESYSWEEFKGINRVPGPTVFSSCDGITLRIIIKGLFQRCLENRTSHSIFATYLIFFSPEQIATTEAILNQHGIKKTE